MVDWIGANLAAEQTLVVASIKKEIMQDLGQQLNDIMAGGNVVSKKVLRSFAGRANHVAGLLATWRPFLQQVWAVLSDESDNAPAGCAWKSRIDHTLQWIKAFLEGSRGALSRTFHLDDYTGAAPKVELTLDASPWGLAGVLAVDHVIVEWFSDIWREEDLARFEQVLGDSKGQQVWESLCALVALRGWSHHWKGKRVVLMVRGDSVAMLTLLLKMRPKADKVNLGLIARELALDVAEGVFEPVVGVHLPGVANVLADVLSRRLDPRYKASWMLPKALVGVPHMEVPRRRHEYYRTLRGASGSAAPAASPSAKW